jgi:hypothetical protein
MTMQRLFEIGFQRAGRWSLEGEELMLQLDELADRPNVLYAFVTGSTVKYVGKTTQSLQRRMFGYQKPNVDQRTNWRNRIAIVELLKRGQQVDILALADTGLLRYGSFHLNLAAGLEDSIIQILKPEWNGGRTSTVIETPTEANPPDTSTEAKLEERVQEVVQHLPKPETPPARPHVAIEIRTDTNAAPPVAAPVDKTLTAAPYFLLTLQNTYHRTGFFNVPLNSDRYFGKGELNRPGFCRGSIV